MTNVMIDLTATRALWRREVVRFLRQRNRVIGALLTPVVFWLLLGSGLNQTFQPDMAGGDEASSPGYLLYFFPGALLLVLMFTAVFSTITVIEDRRSGFLQTALVSPADRGALVLGMLLGGVTLAMLQGFLFMLLWLTVGPWPGLGGWAAAIGAMLLVSFMMTGLGLCLAWPMSSTAGFHAVMNLVLMPMWFLSGAVFPAATAPSWLQFVMLINPLTYGHQLLASALQDESGTLGFGVGIAACWAVALAAAVASIWAARRVAGRG